MGNPYIHSDIIGGRFKMSNNLIVVVFIVMQITAVVAVLICYKKTKIHNKTNFDTLKNLISENQSATTSNLNSLKESVTSGQTIIINNLNKINDNFDALKNLISKNQSASVSNLDSLKELITNNQTNTIDKLNMIDKNSENILKELKEPLSLD